jgi:hypothetical protein
MYQWVPVPVYTDMYPLQLVRYRYRLCTGTGCVPVPVVYRYRLCTGCVPAVYRYRLRTGFVLPVPVQYRYQLLLIVHMSIYLTNHTSKDLQEYKQRV